MDTRHQTPFDLFQPSSSSRNISGAGFNIWYPPLKSSSHLLSFPPILEVSLPSLKTPSHPTNTGKMHTNASKRPSSTKSSIGKWVNGREQKHIAFPKLEPAGPRHTQERNEIVWDGNVGENEDDEVGIYLVI